MANFLYKLGSAVAKHKWMSVAIWFLVLLIIVVPLLLNSPKFQNDITMNGLKSLDTNDKISKEFNQDSEKASTRIVFHSNSENGITNKSTKKDIKKMLDNIKKDDDYVHAVVDPYDSGQVNDEKRTAYADVNYVVSSTGLKDSSKKIVNDEIKDLKDKHNLQIEKTNKVTTDAEVGGSSEAIGIIVAFVILFITFGSFIAAGLPIISALIGLGSSIGIIALLTFAFDIPNLTLSLAVMIGLAVGIDYALFILFRFKEISKREPDYIKAIGLAVGTAGSAVIFAGVTVIVAVCGLALVGIDFLAVMGFSSAISVLFSVFSALTLLPAFISIFHKKINKKSKKTRNKIKNEKENTPWAKFIVGKPFLAVILSLLVLIIMIIPVTHMRLGMPDDSVKPEGSSAKKAFDMISDEFGPGYNGQIVMLVNTKDGGSEKDINRELNNISEDIKDFDNVETVTSPRLNDNNNYAILSIIPEEGPNEVSTTDLVYDLRDYNKKIEDKYEFESEISGQSVINIDMSEKLNNAIPVFMGSIVLLAFILLMVVFRSILIPLKAVLGFALSLGASLGFTTLLMQDGFLSQLFGVSSTGPLLAFLPVIVIGVLFGLAIDYELFLMSRIHEEYTKSHDNNHAISVGIKQSGPVIVAAALIMFSVFIAFAFQDDVAIKSIGIALGFGVLFDAFVVRLTLIPALTKLFGNASWYLPKWLGFVLPNIDVEGAALSHLMPDTTEKTDSHRETHNTIDETERTDGLQSNSVHYRMPSNNMEIRTKQLYQDIVFDSYDQTELNRTLMEHARRNNPEVYRHYNEELRNQRPNDDENQ